MNFQSLLQRKNIVLLDGAMGSELQRRGFGTSLPLWSATASTEAPELLREIHSDYIKAGADIITANTFRTSRYTYAKIGRESEADLAMNSAVEIARMAVKQSGRSILIAGSVTTLEDCYEPKKVPDNAVLQKYHRHQINALAEMDVDFILLETMNNSREALLSSQIAAKTGKAFAISLITNGNGQLMSGDDLTDTVLKIAQFKPSAILLNCRSLQTINRDLPTLQQAWQGHCGAYANGYGNPDHDWGWISDSNKTDSLQDFINTNDNWIRSGIKIIGGCCGTTPMHIAELNKLTNG
ncbi:MAG: homocysteine S-methyltransferase family protein [Flavobacteriales bacterium]